MTVPAPSHPVITAHAAAEAAIEALSIDDLLASGMADGPHPAQIALQEALAIRASTPAELRFRLDLLAETLHREEASDHALSLLAAAIADLDALTPAAQVAPATSPARTG